MIYELSFLKALVLTIAIETIVLFFLFQLVFKSTNIKSSLLLFTGIFATFATLPYLWFLAPVFIKTKLYYMLIGELSVVLIESVIISGILRIGYAKAVLASFVCNLVSFLTGLLINNLV